MKSKYRAGWHATWYSFGKRWLHVWFRYSRVTHLMRNWLREV